MHYVIGGKVTLRIIRTFSQFKKKATIKKTFSMNLNKLHTDLYTYINRKPTTNRTFTRMNMLDFLYTQRYKKPTVISLTLIALGHCRLVRETLFVCFTSMNVECWSSVLSKPCLCNKVSFGFRSLCFFSLLFGVYYIPRRSVNLQFNEDAQYRSHWTTWSGMKLVVIPNQSVDSFFFRVYGKVFFE